jgi:hypothetical protein
MIQLVKRHLVATGVALVVLVTAVGVAVAAAGGGDSPESPESGVRGEGVPEGPFVDFCPTPEQVEAHLDKYGFDYKPTVPCTVEGEPAAPTPVQLEDTAADPDEDVSAKERCALAKDRWLSGKPLPDADDDALSIEYETADGQETAVQVFGDPKVHEGMSIDEFARSVNC